MTALVILRGCHLQCSWYSSLANIYIIFLPDISFHHLSTISWTDLKKSFSAYSLFKKEIIVHLHEVSNNTLDWYFKVITFGLHENGKWKQKCCGVVFRSFSIASSFYHVVIIENNKKISTSFTACATIVVTSSCLTLADTDFSKQFLWTDLREKPIFPGNISFNISLTWL